MMADEYIKRADAKDAIQQALYDGTGYGEALDTIPAADVRPVVLCKDCEYYHEAHRVCGNAHCICGAVFPSDYCSHASRSCGADMREPNK